MSVLFFKLRGVPDDEAEEIRELLSRHEIDYYETPAGNWGVSMPALWLRNEAQWQQAKVLLDEYQQQRRSRAREAYRQHKLEGRGGTLVDFIKNNPAAFIAGLALLAVLLYISTVPFVYFLH